MNRFLACRLLQRPSLLVSSFTQLQSTSSVCTPSRGPKTTWSLYPRNYQSLNYPLRFHALSYSSASQFSTEVDTVELENLLNADDVQLIDIREPEELIETGQIPSSVNIPLGTLDDAFQMSSEDFKTSYGIKKPSVGDDNIIFHCKRGIRSRVAMEIAIKHGYTLVRHYYPGMDGWLQKDE